MKTRCPVCLSVDGWHLVTCQRWDDPTAQEPVPPRRRGRPSLDGRQVQIMFPYALLAELQSSADAAGTSIAAEVRRRCGG